VAPLLFGGSVFQSAIVEFWLPVFGDIKFVTSTIFDIGVYIVVVGLVLDVLRTLGAEIDEHFEEQPRTPAGSQPSDAELPDTEQAQAEPSEEAGPAPDWEAAGVPAETTGRGQS
jgi:multicomponent Na+:H+ antiporter subunit A